jgi:hypothetical protein
MCRKEDNEACSYTSIPYISSWRGVRENKSTCFNQPNLAKKKYVKILGMILDIDGKGF